MRRPSAAFILIISLLSSLMACPILAGPIEDSRKAYRGGDYKTAFQLIKPEAEKGDAVAQFILGYMYDEGKGVPKDYDEAVKWYSRAAKQGNKEARHNLGLMGDQDQVSKDRAEKEKWHRGAAEPQNAAAPPNLVLMDNQDQVSKDRAGMEKWHRGAE
jgi:TPR repeat protein